MEILRITDGQSEVSFLSGDYHLLSWSPAVAKRADNLLEPSPFQNVTERMTIAVKDYEKMQILTQLLDQAQRWRRGEDTRPVRLEYKLTSASAVLVALIVGVSGSMVGLPTIYSLSEATGLVDDVTIEFERQGEWLTPDQTNLIENGGFEDWTDDEPDDWTIVSATVTEENTIIHDGTSSARVQSGGVLESIYQSIVVVPGNEYQVSAWVYADSGRARMRVVETADVINVFTLEPDTWEYFSGTFTATGTSVDLYFVGASAGSDFYIDDVELKLVSGSGEVGDVATVDDLPNGEIATLDFGTGQERYPSPTKVVVSDVFLGSYHPRAFLIVANGVRQITLADNEDFGWILGAPFAAQTDTTAYARDDTVARLTPATTSAYRLQVRSYDLNLHNVKRVGIFANVRNNSATTQFTLRALSFAPGGTFYARPIVIPGDATPSPQWVYLGPVTSNRDGVFFIDITASAASGTLDIDTVAFVALDNMPAIISIDQSANVGTSDDGHVVANHHVLTETSPKVEIIRSGFVTGWSARGNIAIYTDAPQIEAVLLATGGDTNVNRWRQEKNGVGVTENNWTASRLPGRLIAE